MERIQTGFLTDSSSWQNAHGWTLSIGQPTLLNKFYAQNAQCMYGSALITLGGQSKICVDTFRNSSGARRRRKKEKRLQGIKWQAGFRVFHSCTPGLSLIYCVMSHFCQTQCENGPYLKEGEFLSKFRSKIHLLEFN